MGIATASSNTFVYMHVVMVDVLCSQRAFYII